MDLLAWPTAKLQLYLLEAAHVKNKVGRERIRRSKDALRELRCLQEILADLHAGEFGHSPGLRRAAEAVAERWALLLAKERRQGVLQEELCKVPPSMRRFLAARQAPGGGADAAELLKPRCGGSSEAATSTRAPSTSACG